MSATPFVQLRPRPMFEATDLGVRLVQTSAPALLRCAGPVMLVLTLACAALLPLGGWAPGLALWLAKPWLDRTLLFVLARAVFHEDTRWADLWAARRSVWGQHLPGTLLLQRLVPWRSFTQAAQQLEGLAGAPLRQRRKVLMRGHQGAALGLAGALVHVELALVVGVPALVLWLGPGGDWAAPLRWLRSTTGGGPEAVLFACYAATVALVEPFFVGAGFAMYLNRRVEIEAWDVEQSLRHAFTPR